MTVSTKHYAIAAIAEYLEQHFWDESFDFIDGGLTLDIKAETLSICRQNPAWQQIERNYSTVGGCISCPNEDLWEVA